MTVSALKGVSLEFRENEFVCVLGPSGCGKTTLLNIIGGLDQYTTGDLIINGVSTKNYKDSDWDNYRNHSIGFVFQTYNLIPHQTVLSNVELALTLTGVSKSERRAKAREVLKRVGLEDQVGKKPNQLSGGQMQRVAIARALVNNPDILLADEPTGSLDSVTSVQIMEILKEIARDKLVIMVTHNPELADSYSTRIVRLLDGLVTSDTVPYATPPAPPPPKSRKRKMPSMSFFTALSLSLTNLLTKKARTFLTAFAGSIGIIGIALILSLSNGLQSYIDRVEEETLSAYPITIDRETFDISSFMQPEDNSAMRDENGNGGQQYSQSERPLDKVYVNQIVRRMMNTMLSRVQTNDLASFKKQLEADSETLEPLITAISYSYDVDITLFREDGSGGAIQVNPSRVFEELGMASASSGFGSFQSSGMSNYNMWSELIDAPEFLDMQYDLVAGHWPSSSLEAVLVINESNRITDLMLYSLGLRGPEQLKEIRQALISGEPLPIERSLSYEYDEILALEYRLILPVDRLKKTDGGGWEDMSENAAYMQYMYSSADTVKIVGIVRPSEDAIAASSSGMIGYTSALTDYIIGKTNGSEIVLEQIANPDINVFTGRPFGDAAPAFADIGDIMSYIEALPPDQYQQAIGNIDMLRGAGASDERIVELFNQSVPPKEDSSSYDENLTKLGVTNPEKPSSISIFPTSFENKESIIEYINNYNDRVDEEYKITFTDYVGLLMSSVTTVINAISYVLIAFVSISLVVSSIMIGIITYISVLERTKEIGVLRSVGASKRDVSRVFTAETLIIGFVAGAIGIAITVLLCIPANAIIYRLTEISNVAVLPINGAVILVLISMALSLIAGLIPSRVAAKKDPVVALRTE